MLIGEFPNVDDHESLTLTADSDSQMIDDCEDWNIKDLVRKRWDLLNDSVKALIVKMISSNPEERPSIKEILD